MGRRRAAADRVRRPRVPVLRGAARAAAGAGREAAVRLAFRHFPVALGAPARVGGRLRDRGRRRCRAASGRCTTRSSRIRGTSRTRTCGRALRRSDSISNASITTAAATPCRAASRATSPPACGRGSVTTPTVFFGGLARTGEALAGLARRARRGLARYPAGTAVRPVAVAARLAAAASTPASSSPRARGPGAA